MDVFVAFEAFLLAAFLGDGAASLAQLVQGLIGRRDDDVLGHRLITTFGDLQTLSDCASIGQGQGVCLTRQKQSHGCRGEGNLRTLCHRNLTPNLPKARGFFAPLLVGGGRLARRHRLHCRGLMRGRLDL
jgi:hypothetical protein